MEPAWPKPFTARFSGQRLETREVARRPGRLSKDFSAHAQRSRYGRWSAPRNRRQPSKWKSTWTVRPAHKLVWDIPELKSDANNGYLVALVDQAKVDGGRTLPLVDSASFANGETRD